MTYDQTSTGWFGRTGADAYARARSLPWPLFIFMAVQSGFWIVMPLYFTKSMHASSAELAMWGRDWFWLNFKHPALASWVMDLAYASFGLHLWVVYFVGQVFLCATYIFVYLLGRALLDEPRAIVAPMLVAGLTYFTVFALRFNHNLVQMPFWAAFAYWLWKASETNKSIWWVLAAMAAALGVYGKFSTAIPIALGCGWILIDIQTRRHLRTVRPYIGLGVFLIMMAPLIYELARMHFATLDWVSQESEDKGVRWTSYYRHQGEYLLRIVALAAIAGAIGFRRSTVRAAAVPDGRRKRLYLVLMGAGPLLFTLALAPLMDLRNAWSTPMFSFMGLVLLAFWPRAVLRTVSPRPVVVALIASIAMGSQFAWEHHLNFIRSATPDQYSYPAQHIAAHFGKIWRHQTHAPLMIVGGDPVASSLAGLNSHWWPAMFSDLDPRESPAMTPQRIRREGMLLVWLVDGAWRPAPEWVAGRVTGVESFRWSKSPNAKPVMIGYAIIPPGSGDIPQFGPTSEAPAN